MPLVEIHFAGVESRPPIPALAGARLVAALSLQFCFRRLPGHIRPIFEMPQSGASEPLIAVLMDFAPVV